MRPITAAVLCLALVGCLTINRRREVKVYRTSNPEVVWVVVSDERFADGVLDDNRLYGEALYMCRRSGDAAAPVCFSAKWEDPTVPASVREAVLKADQ